MMAGKMNHWHLFLRFIDKTILCFDLLSDETPTFVINKDKSFDQLEYFGPLGEVNYSANEIVKKMNAILKYCYFTNFIEKVPHLGHKKDDAKEFRAFLKIKDNLPIKIVLFSEEEFYKDIVETGPNEYYEGPLCQCADGKEEELTAAFDEINEFIKKIEFLGKQIRRPQSNLPFPHAFNGK